MIGNTSFTVVVAFDTDKFDKATGDTKKKNSKFLVQAVDFSEAYESIIKYLKTDSRGWTLKSISESKFEDIVNQKEKISILDNK